MKIRSAFLAIPFALITLVVGFGCGGAGSGGSSTTATSTTGTTNTTGTTSTTGTSGPSITVQMVPTTGYVTVASPRITLTASIKGVTDPNMQWQFTTESTQNVGNNQTILAPPGSQGSIQTVSGTNIDGLQQAASTVVYAGDPTLFTSGGNDTILITAWSSKLPFGQASTMINIPTGTDWVTLPTAITSAVGGISNVPATVKPGTNIQATVSLVPSNSCTSASISPVGFTPTNVTVNGKAATFPINYTFPTNGAPLTITLGFTVPASIIADFPVDNAAGTLTGPWMGITGSGLNGGWQIAQPFFIHS